MLSINSNKLLLILSFLVLGISLILFWGTYEKMIVEKNQIKVYAKVIEAPEDCSSVTSRGGYCNLEYNGKIYVKKAGIKFCDLVSNKEQVLMLTNKNRNKLFFIGSYKEEDYIYSLLIFILSIIAIRQSLKSSS
ncbi:hypothetical protein [Polaribacter marinivivus]|uniref:Uncharacterized protein n=1 Tax=Polaribacter marinivivus TaxID=1524260 RepID=A0ABV8R6T4_9FLAO